MHWHCSCLWNTVNTVRDIHSSLHGWVYNLMTFKASCVNFLGLKMIIMVLSVLANIHVWIELGSSYQSLLYVFMLTVLTLWVLRYRFRLLVATVGFSSCIDWWSLNVALLFSVLLQSHELWFFSFSSRVLGTKEDLWNTVPPKMAQRVLAGMLNESLTILAVRYTQVWW